MEGEQDRELRHLVLAVGALAEGITLRLNFYPEYEKRIPVPSDVEPATQTSSLAAVGVGVEAILLHMLEIDPDWTPTRTLTL